MEMKNTVRRIAPIVLIMYLPIRDFFFSSSSKIPSINIIPHPQSSCSSSTSTSIYQNLFIFFTFNLLLVAVLLGISSHLSKPSPISPSPIDSHDQDINIDHDCIPEIFCIDYVNDTHFYFKIGEIEAEEEVYDLPCDYGYVDQERKDDFVPGIVQVEYCKKEEEVGRESNSTTHDDCKKEKDGILICDHEEYGYDDEEEDDSYSELDDVDLNKRIEEFIGVNNKKWREELHNDMLMLSQN